MKELCLIVSNYYHEFATTHPGVYTYTQFTELLEQKSPAIADKDFMIGQGLSDKIRKQLETRVKEIAPELRLINKFPPTAEKHIVHKHKPENVLISKPIHIEPLKYSAHLVINDNCAEMSDHQTGQHIQGMVLLEAGRQMMIASSELFLLGKNIKAVSVLQEMNVKYYNYAFPLPVEIECIFNREPVLGKIESVVELTVNYYQLGKLNCTISSKATFSKPKIMQYIESSQANEVLKELRSNAVECSSDHITARTPAST